MTMFLIYVLASVGLNGALVIRTIYSFKGKAVATLTSTIYATLSMLVGYLTASVNQIDLLTKILITVLTASVGVFFGKVFEEKMQKEKTFKIEVTVTSDEQTAELLELLQQFDNLSKNTVKTDNGTTYNIYQKGKKCEVAEKLQKTSLNFLRIA